MRGVGPVVVGRIPPGFSPIRSLLIRSFARFIDAAAHFSQRTESTKERPRLEFDVVTRTGTTLSLPSGLYMRSKLCSPFVTAGTVTRLRFVFSDAGVQGAAQKIPETAESEIKPRSTNRCRPCGTCQRNEVHNCSMS